MFHIFYWKYSWIHSLFHRYFVFLQRSIQVITTIDEVPLFVFLTLKTSLLCYLSWRLHGVAINRTCSVFCHLGMLSSDFVANSIWPKHYILVDTFRIFHFQSWITSRFCLHLDWHSYCDAFPKQSSSVLNGNRVIYWPFWSQGCVRSHS